jgi:hypothetical protein
LEKTVKYLDYRYLFPPRPETAAAPTTLNQYEDRGWLAQAKMNGTCCTIYVSSTGTSFAMGRHGMSNRLNWQPGEKWQEFQRHLPGKGWYVFVGELLHSKGVGITDTIYLHDLLVDDGEYLVGETYLERYQRLLNICDLVPAIESTLSPYNVRRIVTPGVWLALNHRQDFREWYNSINKMPGHAVEGLVFKQPHSKLVPCGTPSANSKWQHKCRRTTKNLSF